jgi:antirestriction protein ArdC
MKSTTTDGGTMTKEKTDIAQRVTDRIIESLEAGVVPWRKPWKSIGGVARNLNSGRPYRGVNVLLTALTSMAAGYTDNRWATFNGIKRAGGSVRKGEKGTLVILWKPIEKKNDPTDPEKVTDKFLMLKGYTVFNVQQADFPDGIPADGDETELVAHDRDEIAETVISSYCETTGVKFEIGGNSASYSPTLDMIRVPMIEQFDSADSYYATAYHEMIHSTGHESRLKRIKDTTFGSEPYADEELVAEIGASMLCALTGREPKIESSAAYIANWLRVLRDDKKFIVTAAARAQKAVDLVLGTSFEKKDETEEGAAPAAS